ncbi:MAG: phage portal protein [Thermoplasmata archaeon]
MAKKININSSKATNVFDGFVTADRIELFPKTDLEKFTKLLEDIDVSNAARLFIDALFYNGYVLVKQDDSISDSKFEIAKQILKDNNFDIALRKIALNCRLYHKAFVELVYDTISYAGQTKKVVKEFYVLHTPTIIPVVDKHGNVKEYIQRVGLDEVKFSKDELVEIEVYPSTASYWGHYDILGLYEIVVTKQLLEQYVDFLFRQAKIVPYWSTEQQITKEAYQTFLENLKKLKNNPAGELVAQGKIERKFLDSFKFLSDIENYVDYLRSKIYEYFGIPSNVLSFRNEATRSSSEVNVRYVWNFSVLSFRDMLEETINNKLLSKLQYGVVLKFNVFDRLEIRDRLDSALKLKALGVNNESIKEFIETGQIKDIKFDEASVQKKKIKDQITNKSSPSRQRRDILDREYKVGSESTTRDDQIGF